jgi:hypothetical protein
VTSREFRVLGSNRWMQVARSEPAVALRCPYCKHQGQFVPLPSGDAWVEWPVPMPAGPERTLAIFYAGRVCPRLECRGVVFCVFAENGVVLHSYPAETVDWDATNLPEPVLATFEEAIIAEANQCYRASALMSRRTLELVCEDQGARGATLLDRLKALGGKAVLPEVLLQALDQLRLLGNDAAHVHARTYATVGPDEARIAIDVTKELLKAVYQLGDLVRRLQELQRSAEADPAAS